MGLSMSQTAAPSSHQPPLDGTAIAAAVKRYRTGEITVEAFLNELRSLRVHGTPAERLAETFAPAHMREGV